MNVLTVNCGSSTLKFDVRTMSDVSVRVATGSIAVGVSGSSAVSVSGAREEHDGIATDYGEAVGVAVDLLRRLDALDGVSIVAHRIVHGGVLHDPAVIDRSVITAIEHAARLAPLHNGPALAAIKAAQAQLGMDVPMVAVFDTAFFAGLPEVAAKYALPRGMSEELGIRRFGFHGLAHRSMAEQYLARHPDRAQARLITLQLGSGCSAAAVRGLEPLDTSMGFSPLEGLVMRTRAGDLDPAIPLFIAQETGRSLEATQALLNEESGLVGLSGLSGDMETLIHAAEGGDSRAEFAIRCYCYRIQKYVGAYMAVIGGADAIIFGGGVGENSPTIRDTVCDAFSWTDVLLDQTANAIGGPCARISAHDSGVDVWVIRPDEASLLATDAVRCMSSAGKAMAG